MYSNNDEKIGVTNETSNQRDGIGNERCATPGCNIWAAPNMLICETCIAIQNLGDASPLNRLPR